MKEIKYGTRNKSGVIYVKLIIIFKILNGCMDQTAKKMSKKTKLIHKNGNGRNSAQKTRLLENLDEKINNEDINLSNTEIRCQFDLDAQSPPPSGEIDFMQNFGDNSEIQQIPMDLEQNKAIENQFKIGSIFDYKEGKKSQIKCEKHSNVLKHILKKFINKGFNKKNMSQIEAEYPQIKKQISDLIKRQKMCYRQQKNWNNNLESMKRIFYVDQTLPNSQLRSLCLRRHMVDCLLNIMIKEVREHNQITSGKKSYIYSMLIQSYRCGSVQLMERTQIF